MHVFMACVHGMRYGAYVACGVLYRIEGHHGGIFASKSPGPL